MVIMKNFEEKMKEIENCILAMDQESTGLEESLIYFERGMALVKDCQETLRNTALKVKKITDELEETDLNWE